MFQPIEQFASWLVYAVLNIPEAGRLGGALHFFVYDTLKILLLLYLITMVMGMVNSYLPIDRLRHYLSRNRMHGLEYLLASVFGAITPFCSCSSVPLFIGFVRGGIPLGVTLSFLITSPLVNEVAIALFLGLFGVKTTVIYILSGVMLGTLGGMLLGRMKLEPWLTPWVLSLLKGETSEGEAFVESKPGLRERLPQVNREALGIMRSVLLYVLIGIGIGAFLHGFVPTGFFEAYLQRNNPLGVPAAVLFGVPMYSNAAGVLPIVQVLVEKGIPLGTAIAFMMAVIGLSMPEATLLKKVMTWRLIAVYFSTVALFITFSGYLFNLIL